MNSSLSSGKQTRTKTRALRLLQPAKESFTKMGTNWTETGELAKRQITDQQLAKYSKLIYERTGVRISPQKKSLLSNRVRRRLRATGIDNYDAYLQKLVSIAADDPEWDAYLQEITTHETYLFRDGAHWEWLQQTFLPQFVKNATQNRLRIWSAACSTGDE